MKKLTALFVVVFAVAFSSNVFAQNTKTASATASARVMTPINLTTARNLNFGVFSSSSLAGTVIIAGTSAGTRTFTGGVTLSSVLPSSTSAEYTVSGETGALFVVGLPTSDVEIKSGSNIMLVNAFTHNSNGILTGGSVNFNVGATINVGATQPSGDYTGTYNVTVSYN